MFGVFASHRVAVSVMFTPHYVMQLALPVVIPEETTGKLPTHEKENREGNLKRAACISENQGVKKW